MRISDFARRLPDEVWAVFEPILPPKVWIGNGCPPIGNRECLHGLLYVLATGIAWEMVPPCFPSGKTIQRRLKIWLQLDCFRQAWTQLAHQYEELRGINWDKVLIDGSKHKAQKGGLLPVPARWIAPSAALAYTWPQTNGRCLWE
jgi:transposase